MIVPDVNLLLYAYNIKSPFHEQSRKWWESIISEGKAVGIPWVVSIGFIRLITSRSVLENPLEPQTAIKVVLDWLAQPNVQHLEPGAKHLILLADLLKESLTSHNLVTDAHLAAIAIEYSAELHSNDSDFGRFSGLKWINPIK